MDRYDVEADRRRPQQVVVSCFIFFLTWVQPLSNSNQLPLPTSVITPPHPVSQTPRASGECVLPSQTCCECPGRRRFSGEKPAEALWSRRCPLFLLIGRSLSHGWCSPQLLRHGSPEAHTHTNTHIRPAEVLLISDQWCRVCLCV